MRQLAALVTLIGVVAAADLANADVLYATSGPVNGQLLTIDGNNGSILNAVPITNDESLFGGLCDDGSSLYSIDGYNDGNPDRLFRIDPATGAGLVIGPTNFNWNFRSSDVLRATGTLYLATDNTLYTGDVNTGAATFVANLSAPNLDQLTAMAISPSGTAYVTDIGNNSLFQVDLSTGALTFIGDTFVGGWFSDLAFDSNGELWGVGLNGGVYTIDLNTAALTLRFGSGSFAGIAWRWDCPVNSYCTAKVNSIGCTPAISGQGVSSASSSSGFVVRAVDMRNNKVGVLLYTNGGQAATPFSGGTLCVGGALKRVQGLNSAGTPPPANDCTGVFSVDMNSFAQGLLGGNPNPFLLVPGTQVDCQFWGRDPGFPAPNNTQLSDGLHFAICP